VIDLPGYDVDAKIYESRRTVVYRARQKDTDRPVVLKTHQAAYPTPADDARFRREYKIGRLVAAHEVVGTYGLREHQRRLVLVREDFGAVGLRGALPPGGMDLRTVLGVAIQLARALAALHQEGIVHRDVKPGNILVHPQTFVTKITDLGLALLQTGEMQETARSAPWVGTPAYMSPEQTGRTNLSLDYRTDFYSLGVTLYECLTGRCPFEVEDEPSLVRAHLAEQPMPLHQVGLGIPKPLSDIVLKLLSKSPEDRYQTALGLQRDLEACLQQYEPTEQTTTLSPARQDVPEQVHIPQERYGQEQEIGAIRELRRHRDRLEEMVRERTAQLEAANQQIEQQIIERKRLEEQIHSSLERRERQIWASTQMSQVIAVVNEEPELYKRAVALVKEQLGYYHAQMFRYDPAQGAAILVAGHGRVGKQMLDEGYRVPAGTGPVGTSVALGTSVLRPDLADDPGYRPPPYLPHTRGELAVPIKLDQWDAHAQVVAVRSFVEGDFDGFVAIAIDEAAATPVFREALDKGLCVVSTNPLGEHSLTAEIRFADYENGYLLGEQAGEWAKKHLSPGETLQVAMYNSPHLAEIVQREVGIMDGIRSVFPNVRLVDTAATAAPARTMPIAQRWLETWPDLHMILGINDSGALGGYVAVIAAGKNDADTFFVGGIDATDDALTAIGEGGAFQATIDQSPREVGVLTVRTLVAAIAGQPHDKRKIIVGTPVNRDNLETFLAQRQAKRVEDVTTLDDLDLGEIRIGMNVIDLQNPFFIEMAEAAMAEARRLGVDLLINDSRQVLGVLSVQSDKAGALDAEDQLVLEGLCGQMATAVKGLRLFGELREAYDSLEWRVEERTAALRESEERFRALAENVPGTIYLCRNDERWTMLYLSDAVEQLTGYAKEDFLSDRLSFVDLYHPDDADLVFSQVEDALARHAPFHLLYRIKHRSGEWRWIEEVGVGIYHDGELQMLEGLLTDITERRQAQEAMVRASRLEATATLAGGIAHQFNNLMVGVLGYAEMLKADLRGDPDALDLLETISRSAQRAGELAQQMLAFARGGKYQPRAMSLNTAIRSVLYAQESLLPPRITLAIDTAPDLWDTEADLAQISQVLLNVLTNAVEAIEDEGRIAVVTRNVVVDQALDEETGPGPYVRLLVQDSGRGMSAEVRARIFEPFFSTKFEGRGLGLAAAYGIVRNHGGHIAIDSQEGHGTTVEIHLPAIRPESLAPPTPTGTAV
jgi:PAS domain S-box-containing protein